MMKFLVGLSMLAALSCARTSTAETVAKDSKTNSLLWKVSGNGLSKPSYVFGTIHMICKDDFVWTNAMQKSFAAADKICMEMDLDDPAMMMGAAMGLMSTDGKTLRDYFKPDEYERLNAWMKNENGMGLEMFNTMKPAMLLSLVTIKSEGCDSTLSYEMVLMDKSKAGHTPKEIIGLEPVAEQLEVLNSIPPDTIVKQVMAVVDHKAAASDDEFEQLVAAYKTQNLTRLDSLMNISPTLQSGDRAIMLDDRNSRWISRMAGFMKTNPTFFAVGAGHLPGQKGILQLLRKAGYTVEAVTK
ncbi:MAG: TraB/GumN family protein [Sphingobacteriales bacterium]|nr:MAG: TraB/GumN family protein [Sphingobacteriales bacterium]